VLHQNQQYKLINKLSVNSMSAMVKHPFEFSASSFRAWLVIDYLFMAMNDNELVPIVRTSDQSSAGFHVGGGDW